MKILVVSDSHDNTKMLDKIIGSQTKAEVVLFLGDGISDLDYVKLKYPQKMFISVRGNNDWLCDCPINEVREIEGKRIFLTHGHRYNVRYGIDTIAQIGNINSADIVLYGHTHEQKYVFYQGMHIMCPGAVMNYPGEYGVIDIQNGQVLVNTAVYKYSGLR